MDVKIDESWKPYLNEEFKKPYFHNLAGFVKQAYKLNRCFPPGNQIFNAFNHCKFKDIKVVIIGQDPYHGFGQANGLSFSVNDGVPHPPSLINIFKEIENDLGIPYPKSGNLSRWAKQGVLLLNATLTVSENQAGSHQKKGWEVFTDEVIRIINKEKENIVFLLWGGFAKQKVKFINSKNHHILTSGHPSPLSANRGYWFGNKHFSKTNDVLLGLSKIPIIW